MRTPDGAQNIPNTHIIPTSKVTLPYPIGITSVANFSKSCRSYTVPARRRISIALVGSMTKNKLRSALAAGMRSIGGTIHVHGPVSIAYKCSPEHGGSQCGMDHIDSFKIAYKRVLHTDFCLEVSGDTPTRSHFYMAVLAGCIPVIFDFNNNVEARGLIRFENPHRTSSHSHRTASCPTVKTSYLTVSHSLLIRW